MASQNETEVQQQVEDAAEQHTSASSSPASEQIPDHRPRIHVTDSLNEYNIYGVDAIWHNQYAGPKSDFQCFRKQYDNDIDTMIRMVAGHIARGLYSVVSMTATKHSLTVVYIIKQNYEDVLDGYFDHVEAETVPGSK